MLPDKSRTFPDIGIVPVHSHNQGNTDDDPFSCRTEQFDIFQNRSIIYARIILVFFPVHQLDIYEQQVHPFQYGPNRIQVKISACLHYLAYAQFP